MKRTLLLVTVLFLSVPASGQVLINEIYTASQDALEILNTGNSTVSLSGWRVEYGGLNISLNWIAGTFTFPGSASIAPGEIIVIRESTSGPSVAPGTTVYITNSNINWATTGGGQTRGGAAVLVNSSNVGVDMIRWLGASPPNAFGASFSGTYNPGLSSFSRIDFTDDDNASDWADESLNLGVLSQGQLSLQDVLSLTLTTTGVGDLFWSVTTSSPAVPGGEIYNLVSLQDFTPDGSGPFFGIGFDAIPLLAQPATPVGPFHTFLDATGQWSFALPAGVVPAGFQVEAVSILLGTAGVDRVSNVVALTF